MGVSKIGDRKISFSPKVPKENEKLCDKCGGIGWLYVEKEDGSKYIEKCTVCDNGIIHICPECGNETGRSFICNNRSCRDKREAKNEQRRYEKATKYTFGSCPKDSCKMFFSDTYGYDNGYFDDLDSLEDYCNDNDIPVPEYIWGTTEKSLSMDAYDIVSNKLEDWYEDAIDRIDDKCLQELQKAFDKFCDECGVGNCYDVDYRTCILIGE